jgi:outer membrane biosynthesis protein TonB
VPAVDLAGPPPAPPAEDEDARDGNGEAIARAIAAAKRAAVRECFERELKQAPKLAGTVVVELDLAPPNTVRDVRVSDDLERPAFTRCVVDTMRDVRFSALDEEVSVRVPYALTPARK